MFSEEEKATILACKPSEHIEEKENNSFVIKDCPVMKCKFCLLVQLNKERIRRRKVE